MNARAQERRAGTLLLYVPVPLCGAPDAPMFEPQACNGLRLWAENFPRVIVLAPQGGAIAPPDYVPLDRIGPSLGRIEFALLPEAWRPDRFARALPAARKRIRAVIARADYLSFAIGGLFGDWGAVACWEAHRQGRPFAVWTDRVESEVTRRGVGQGSWRSSLRARLTHRPMAALERAIVRRASLGLFHGRDTYDAYAPFCGGASVLLHDIHLSKRDHIQPVALAAKQASALRDRLRLAYVGRAEPMKGALDWVAVMERLAARGLDFEATWLGEGSERAEMLRRIAQSGLGARVRAPGLADRDAVFAAMRAAHLFLFCHKTPESPRCLIEALVSGAPIVGYASAYPRDLVARHGGGLFSARDDVAALADLTLTLAEDRGRIAALIGQAAQAGAAFEDVAVFEHRSAAIKRHLPGPLHLKESESRASGDGGAGDGAAGIDLAAARLT